MPVTFHDYEWLRPQFSWWVDLGYGVALVKEMAPAQLLDALGASKDQAVAIGLEAVREANGGIADVLIEQNIGVLAVDDGWTLIVQSGGAVVVNDILIRPIAESHQWVSHYSSVNSDCIFQWWDDGVKQVEFDPFFPTMPWRGAHPERLRDEVRAVGGIDVDDEGEEFADRYKNIEASFALTERLSGVRITAEMLEDRDFITARIPMPVYPPMRPPEPTT